MQSTLVIAVTGLSMASQLGRGVSVHRRELLSGKLPEALPWKSLPELQSSGSFEQPWAETFVRPLPTDLREKLAAGLLAPASNLAVMMARDALADAGRRDDELTHCGLYVASSRGNVAGWVDAWPKRRARALVAASNSAHVELASGIQRELALEGPVHVSADGCAAGLSALALAYQALQAGEIQRALVVAVDLPLGESIMRAYAQSGILGTGSNAPWSEQANGMVPAEGGAAVLLEKLSPKQAAYFPTLEQAITRHEGFHLLHPDPQAKRLRSWLEDLSCRSQGGWVLCPHASGTASNRHAELRALEALEGKTKALFCPRPWLGHSIGATGLLDWVLALHCWRQGERVVADAGLVNEPNFVEAGAWQGELRLLNWSLGMGGQFAACVAKAAKYPAHQGAMGRYLLKQKELLIEDAQGKELLRVPCSSSARGVGFEEGSYKTPTGRFEVREKYGYATSARTTFVARKPQAPWTDAETEGTKVTHGILRLHGLEKMNANTWQRYIYVHGTNQLCYPPESLSHGCLTLEENDFRAAFRLLPEGAQLFVE